jgi:hypothetical protein
LIQQLEVTHTNLNEEMVSELRLAINQNRSWPSLPPLTVYDPFPRAAHLSGQRNLFYYL